jgi:hypothetical protein
MEQILAKSVNDQQEIGSRVAALLAGTSLTTTSGVEIRRREPVEEIGYQTVGKYYNFIHKTRMKHIQEIGTEPVISKFILMIFPILRWARPTYKKKGRHVRCSKTI